MKERRIVITGLGTINPIGSTVGEFWDNLVKGKSGIRTVQSFVLDNLPVNIAAEIDLPDVKEYFTHTKLIRRMDRSIVFGVVAGVQAMRDAGIEDYPQKDRVSVLIGTGDGGIITHYQQITQMNTHNMSSVSPFYIPSAIPNTASALLSIEHGFTGPNFSVNSACATANHALGIAHLLISNNICDIALAGGTEAPVSPTSFSGFSRIGALSTRNDDPEAASRPFDRDRDGFVLGEGAGVLCLEELEHAKKRGAHIYAEISGFGFSADAHDLVAPKPDGLGAAMSIQSALNMAKRNPSDIHLVNCHGTSTPIGDRVEYIAIQKVFGSYADRVPVHSTKSMIGHLLGGASGVEAIADIMAFEQGILHPSINYITPDPEIHYNVITESIEKKIDSFISNSFGFGGQNASVIFERFTG